MWGVVQGVVELDREMVTRGILRQPQPPIKLIQGILIVSTKIETETVKKLFDLLPTEEKGYTHKLNTCRRYLRRGRSKRGLIDVGGDILHIVFGTATDKEVDEAKAGLRIQSIALKNLHKETVTTRRAVERQETVLNETLKMILKDKTLERLLRLCNAYNQLEDDVVNNRLDMGELDIQSLQTTVDQFGLKYQLETVGRVNTQSFGKSVQTRMKGNQVIISIPFTTKELLDHYKLTPLPIMINGSRMIVEIEKKHVVLSN